MATVVAIDVGEKKIGLAVGDTDHRFAFPRPALLVDDWSEAWAPLMALFEQEHATQIVIGWPTNMSGEATEQTQRVTDFMQELQARTSLPMIKRDERWSSLAVQKEHQGRDLPRGAEDSLAAQALLESFLSEQA